jgi:hypothetical protein
MVGSSVLPIAFHKNKLYFLFGKENAYNDTPGWADFGGGVESGESVYKTAMREGGEELSGFLGDAKQIEELIKRNGGIYKINHNDKYHIHVFKMNYDNELPNYYNRSHDFLWKNMDDNNKHSVYFEKIEIGWMTVQDIKNNRNIFRNFFREIIDHILEEVPNITRFFKSIKLNKTVSRSKFVSYKKSSKKSKTRKHKK